MNPSPDHLIVCLKSIPENTPSNARLYLAGNFNNWQVADEAFRFEWGENDMPEVKIPRGNFPNLAFKVNRGSWQTVEGDAWGQEIPNHQIIFPESRACFVVSVLSWKDLPQISHFQAISDYISVYYTYYFMPQLARERDVWVHLPPDYRQNQQKHYPVIYMQDGQNLFAELAENKQTWEVDLALNQLFMKTGQGVIVVGIENGELNRLNEYAPWPNPKYGGGEGKQYAQFLAETLKPLIDKSFRTKPAREDTAIMGSSMGGLISLFTALQYPGTFGKVGVFSPSLWFSDHIYSFVHQQKKQFPQRILLMGSRQEDDSMLSDLLAMYQNLREIGFNENELHLGFHKYGEHNEWFWAQEFQQAFEWLFEVDDLYESNSLISNHIFIALKNNHILVQLTEIPANLSFKVFDDKGLIILQNSVNQLVMQIDLQKMKKGIYYLKFFIAEELYYFKKLEVG
jgi:predicted alpha/beta superfamily hydrolase